MGETKVLVLTWEDMRRLDRIMSNVEDENFQAERRGREIPFDGDEGFYSEVLRRFKEARK